MNDPLYPRECEETTPTLFVMVGLPGSGKSTWAHQQALGHSSKYSIISTDYFLEMDAKKYGQDYTWAFETRFKKCNQKAMEQARMAIKEKKHIIWDQTHMTLKSRRRALSMVTKDYNKIVVVFELELRELFARIEKRGKTTGKIIPPHVIDNMQDYYKFPTLEEGFDKIYVNAGNEYIDKMKMMTGIV